MKKRNEVVEQHYRTHYDRIVRSIGHAVGYDGAQDVAQEAYTRALNYWDSFDPNEASFDTWFTAILNNAKSDHLSSMRNRPYPGGLNDHAKAMGVSGGAFQRMKLSDIADRLKCEKPTAKKAITMALCLGYKYNEVAEVLPLTSKNVEKIVNRFRKRL